MWACALGYFYLQLSFIGYLCDIFLGHFLSQPLLPMYGVVFLRCAALSVRALSAIVRHL